MKPDEDESIRQALRDAHGTDAARAPSFDRVWASAAREVRSRPSAAVWLVTCGSLVAALGLATWLIGHLGPPPAPLPSGARWVGPTDFLLQTPGLVTLRTVPAFPDAAWSREPRNQRGNP